MSTVEATPTPAEGGFSLFRTIRSLGASLFINAAMPYFIYRLLEPHFPTGSIVPLLVSTVFPLLGLGAGIARRRAVDYIAIISLVEISISIVVTIAANDVRLALVARALQGTLTGVFFLLTVMVRRPLLYYIAHQFVAASSPGVLKGFEQANQRDGRRTFSGLTVLWGFGTILVSVVNLGLAMTVSPADYLLIAPILGIGTNVVLIIATIRLSTTRLRRVGEAARAGN